MIKPIKIILAGGGTGGHITPIVAVKQALREIKMSNLELLWLGSHNGPEKNIAKDEDINFKAIACGKIRRYFSWKNFSDFFRVIAGIFQAIIVIGKFRPKAIFAKGGYVSLPIVLAGWLCRVPIISHESDMVMGITNCLTSKLAQKICLGFPANNYDLPKKKIIFTGTPVRKEFLRKNFSNSKTKSILIMGGSQGAHIINKASLEIMPALVRRYQVFHIAGPTDYLRLKRELFNNWYLYQYVNEEMSAILKRADLVISRAGATSLAEIAVQGKPAIIVPYPAAAGNHQLINAQYYQKKEAIILIEQKNFSPNYLLEMIDWLFLNPQKMQELEKNIARLAKPDAALRVAEEILKVINK